MNNDPSLDGGYVEVYQRQFSVLIKAQSLTMEDRVMARIFRQIQGFKIELTSESNVSFLYLCHIERKELVKLLEETQEEVLWFRDIFSGQHSYQLLMKSPKEAILRVSDEQKYKHYDLVTLNFHLAAEEQLRKSVMFRYERMRIREKMLDGYLENICGVIKTKNPSLLLQLGKSKKTVFK